MTCACTCSSTSCVLWWTWHFVTNYTARSTRGRVLFHSDLQFCPTIRRRVLLEGRELIEEIRLCIPVCIISYSSSSLCPTIYGHELVKTGLVLGLFGGTQKYSDSLVSIMPVNLFFLPILLLGSHTLYCPTQHPLVSMPYQLSLTRIYYSQLFYTFFRTISRFVVIPTS